MTSQDTPEPTLLEKNNTQESTTDAEGKLSAFLFRFTIPILLILFVVGITGIFAYANHQQSKLISSFVQQEEQIYKQIVFNALNQQSGLKASSSLTEKIFQETRANLQQNFIILSVSLAIYLFIFLFIIRKLKNTSAQLQVFVQRLKGMNNELQGEIFKRDEMAHRLEDLNQELKYQSLHDALTKLPNRRLFEDRINSTIETSKRNKLNFAVMFVDLDGFKIINDTLGHDIGDELLQEVSTRFSNTIRAMDTVARLGGDEFAFIVTQVDRPEYVGTTAERLLECLAEPIVIKGQQLNINASIGITIYPYDSDNAMMLLKNADIAMYHAKNLGRGNFQFYREEMNVASKRELMLRNSLDGALQNSELQIFYQPIVDVEEHAVVHFEALLRWQHPQLGAIPPQEIIRLTHHLGLHLQLGDWIFHQVCQQLKTWREANFNVPAICVNISSVQLESPNYISKLKNILETYEVDPSAIILEVTESSLIQHTAHITELLRELNELGIKIAIDDFGTGYSSLSYLRRLKIQVLKIDQSFIHDLNKGTDNIAIVQAIIALANILRLDTIAEGIETREQMETLKNLGCKKMQGYYFSKPLPASECLHIVIPSKG